MDVISLMGTTNPTELILSKVPTTTITSGVPSTTITNGDEHGTNNHQHEQTSETSQPLMIDFNDPSTTNFLLSALASGASSDSNAIVNHLFQKAQTQQRVNTSSPPIKRKLPMTTTGVKNYTETTNLLPSSNAVPSQCPPTVLQAASNNDMNQQTLILTNSHTNEEQKSHQQIFFINNKPYVIQQKLNHDQSLQQRFILTPSFNQPSEG